MAGWVCDVCLVRNDDGDIVCCCCTTAKPVLKKLIETAGKRKIASVEPVHKSNDEASQSKIRKTVRRIILKYKQRELKPVTLFVVGSGEIDQIPINICDKEGAGKASEIKPLYECINPTPILDGIDGTITSVACGALHTVVTTKEGEVYSFGCNDMGALGRDMEAAEEKGVMDCNPFIVKLPQIITKVSCGDNHTLFLEFNGRVFFAGAFRDSSGNIGIPDFDNKAHLSDVGYHKKPVLLPLKSDNSNFIKDICSGGNHCIALPTDGSGLFVFGSNEFGQLMVPENYTPKTAVKKVDLSDDEAKKLALTWPQYLAVDDLYLDGNGHSPANKRRRYSEERISRIFTGSCTTFFETLTSKRIYGSGRNAHGEVGCGSDELVVTAPTGLLGLRSLNLKKLVGGQYFTVALTNEGELYTWGNNCYNGHGATDDFGKLSEPTRLNFVKDRIDNVFVGADSTFAVTAKGHLYAWGSEQNYILGNGKDGVFQRIPKRSSRLVINGMKVVDGMGGTQHTVFICRKTK